MTAATTPADLTITARDPQLGNLELDDAVKVRWWHGGDPVATAYFSSLSAAFPQGETFFIEVVRRFRDQTAGALHEQIGAFVKQEAMHTREHVIFNQLIKSAGYDTSNMDAETRRRIDLARSSPPLVQLAITVALEHFTAIMAHSLLTEAKPMPGTPARVLRLWQWHALEEIEHKAVAFDTFLAVTKNLSAFKRWALRCHVMLLISLQFWHANFQRMADFFRQDGINTPLTWLRVARYLLIKPGMLRRMFWSYLSFYRPGFHPWNHDDRALIGAVEQRLAAAKAK